MTAVTERCLQCMLLVACVLVLSFDLATPVSCQGGCVPPLVTPGYMDPLTIANGSWTPTTSVTVKIDERYFLWGSTVVNRIQDGEVKWNSALTCSGVSFHDFAAVVFNQKRLCKYDPVSPSFLVRRCSFTKPRWQPSKW